MIMTYDGIKLVKTHICFLFHCRSSASLTMEEISGLLKVHSERVISPGTRQIFISRSNVWSTAFHQFKRPRFADSCDMLYVTFASDEHDAEEDAADLGGPRREFFRLLGKAIFQDSGAFEGNSELGWSQKHLSRKKYNHIPKMFRYHLKFLN